jgi:hypothetical protein
MRVLQFGYKDLTSARNKTHYRAKRRRYPNGVPRTIAYITIDRGCRLLVFIDREILYVRYGSFNVLLFHDEYSFLAYVRLKAAATLSATLCRAIQLPSTDHLYVKMEGDSVRWRAFTK